jgi:hypothetical protein
MILFDVGDDRDLGAKVVVRAVVLAGFGDECVART